MFDILPLPDRYEIRPLPSREVAPERTPPKQRVEAPFLVRSHLHAIRGGVDGWSDELEFVEALTDQEFNDLERELLHKVKELALRNAILGWSSAVRAARAVEISSHATAQRTGLAA